MRKFGHGRFGSSVSFVSTGGWPGTGVLELYMPENDQYSDRRNELDIRVGKVLRFARTRSVVSVDIFNALNSDAVITYNQPYATYLRPTEILNARLMKVSWQFDF